MTRTVVVFVAVLAVFAAATAGFGGSVSLLADDEQLDIEFSASGGTGGFELVEPEPELAQSEDSGTLDGLTASADPADETSNDSPANNGTDDTVDSSAPDENATDEVDENATGESATDASVADENVTGDIGPNTTAANSSADQSVSDAPVMDDNVTAGDDTVHTDDTNVSNDDGDSISNGSETNATDGS
ncbi:MAG: hypothetical protein V5A45_10495, partial [Haloarculaceae archaeon]